jgi:hypothetical protein
LPPSSFHPDSSEAPLQKSLLARRAEDRAREFRYRCAQAVIFGLPVLALQWLVGSLGGSPQEARRWVAILQMLLAGWVVYVAGAGLLAEGILLLPRRVLADLPVAALAVTLYVYSIISVAGVFVRGTPFYEPLFFHWVVLILAGWCGWRWRAFEAVIAGQSNGIRSGGE